MACPAVTEPRRAKPPGRCDPGAPERSGQGGRHAAIRQVLAEVAAMHPSKLYRRALALTRETGDAWDLVQDAFERALTAAPPELQRERLERWLLVTLRNLGIDRHRRSRMRRSVPFRDELVAAASPDVKILLQRWRLVDETDLERAIEGLDPRLREVYRLHADHRLPLATIATTLDIPVDTVATRLHRARRKLRVGLKRTVSLTQWVGGDARYYSLTTES